MVRETRYRSSRLVYRKLGPAIRVKSSQDPEGLRPSLAQTSGDVRENRREGELHSIRPREKRLLREACPRPKLQVAIFDALSVE